jgi:hypothetical protein
MAPYIPFLNNPDAAPVLRDFYSDATCVRITLDRAPKLIPLLTKPPPLWIDTSFEGFHHPPNDRNPDWKTFIVSFTGNANFDTAAFLAKPDKKSVQLFVTELLDACLKHKPQRITIPQFPADKENTKAKINRALAEAACRWRAQATFSGSLIFPLLITHKTLIESAVERNKRLDHVKRCMDKVAIDGVWFVDCSLSDQTGIQNLEKERFPDIIKVAEELRTLLGKGRTICAGPYWGLNLLLWARGIIDSPAIGLGGNYQYHIHGFRHIHPSDVRVALPPLRRWAVRSLELEKWLKQSVTTLGPANPATRDFSEILRNFTILADRKQARRQVAQFYKKWFDLISANPAMGLALALFQDLSSAYVLGKTLSDLPKDEKTGRRPERVAQQLMLNCL